MPSALSEEYLEKIKLTRKEIRIIHAIISQVKRFLKGEPVFLKNLFSLPEYIQNELPGIAILLYILDKVTLSYEILDIFYKELLPGRTLPLLVNGNTLQEKWGFRRGPIIKEVLDNVRIAQIEGKITTQKDAYKFIDKFVKNHI